MVGTKFKFSLSGYLYLIKEYNQREGYRLINLDTESEEGYYPESTIKEWLSRKEIVIKSKIKEVW